jgi:hypothetical protein
MNLGRGSDSEMDDLNPYKSPEHSGFDSPLIVPQTGGATATGCWSAVMSAVVVMLSGVFSLWGQSVLGDWAQLPVFLAMSVVGLLYVGYSHWAVRSEQRLWQQRLRIQNDELHS